MRCLDKVCFLWFLFCTSSLCAEEQTTDKVMPSIAFLEFLGEWETNAGEWLDPIELESDEFDQKLESDSTTDNEN